MTTGACLTCKGSGWVGDGLGRECEDCQGHQHDDGVSVQASLQDDVRTATMDKATEQALERLREHVRQLADDVYNFGGTGVAVANGVIALVRPLLAQARREGVRDALKAIPHSKYCQLVEEPRKGQVCYCYAHDVWEPIHDLFVKQEQSE